MYPRIALDGAGVADQPVAVSLPPAAASSPWKSANLNDFAQPSAKPFDSLVLFFVLPRFLVVFLPELGLGWAVSTSTPPGPGYNRRTSCVSVCHGRSDCHAAQMATLGSRCPRPMTPLLTIARSSFLCCSVRGSRGPPERIPAMLGSCTRSPALRPTPPTMQ